MTTPEIDQNTIRKIIDCINWNDMSGWSFTGEYTVFSGSHHTASYMNRNYPDQYPDSVPPIQRHLHVIQTALWSLETTFERLDWQKKLFLEDKIDSGMFGRFCQQDIKTFHVDYRSFFDYMALIIRQLAVKPGQTPDSFEKLINNKDKYSDVLQEPVFKLLDKFSWFYSARQVRTELIHNGNEVLVFHDKGPISFQVIDRLKNLIQIEAFALNENNVLDYELYSAFYMAHLYSFLDEFSKIALHFTTLKRDESSRYSHPGLGVLKEWLQKLELKLFSSSAVSEPV